jgi:pilus assembly protein CpaB
MAAKKYAIILYSSLAVAILAAYMVFRLINTNKARSQIATLPVVVAARDIQEGAAITDTDLRIEQWPEPVVPDNAFDGIVRVSGRVAHVPIFAGEAIVPGRLAPEGTAPGLEARITPGKRALGVRINDVSGMSGMIQPNSRVDIVVTYDKGGDPGQRTARLVMEDMRVLAMGSQLTRGADGRAIPSTVATIEVTVDEAERLAAAEAQGTIQLMLRGYNEPQTGRTRATSGEVAASVGTSAPPPKQPARNTRSAPAPKQQQTSTPAPVPEAASPPPAPPVSVPQVRTPRPDSVVIPVYRGPKRSDEKIKKDSVRRDTIPR